MTNNPVKVKLFESPGKAGGLPTYLMVSSTELDYLISKKLSSQAKVSLLITQITLNFHFS